MSDISYEAILQKAKEELDFIFQVCDTIQAAGYGIDDENSVDLKDAFLVEIHRFLMYLSASDGKVVTAEKNFMNDLITWKGLTGKGYSNKDYANIIQNTNTYSESYEDTLPLTMLVFAQFDFDMGHSGAPIDEDFPYVLPVVMEFYKTIGLLMISVDNDVADQELADLETYINKKVEIIHDLVDRAEEEIQRQQAEAEVASRGSGQSDDGSDGDSEGESDGDFGDESGMDSDDGFGNILGDDEEPGFVRPKN
ncbi:MAG: hypothetical protein K6E10_08955 [Eubacterium sp.]|nr:hypothetical protein [Eubacterium sp.]